MKLSVWKKTLYKDVSVTADQQANREGDGTEDVVEGVGVDMNSAVLRTNHQNFATLQ